MSKKKPTLTEVPPDAAPLEGGTPVDPASIPEPPPPVRATNAELPTMGRTVRYRDANGHEAPAVVSGVNEDDTLALHVFYRTGVAGKPDIDSIGESSNGGEGWFWPART